MIFSLKKFIFSFKNAVRGIKVGFVENNFRLMFFLAVLALIGIAVFPLEKWEVVVIIFLIGMVFSIELINSQLERILDIVNPLYSEQVRDIKDISAGAVLIISLTSLIIAILIFIPYLLTI